MVPLRNYCGNMAWKASRTKSESWFRSWGREFFDHNFLNGSPSWPKWKLSMRRDIQSIAVWAIGFKTWHAGSKASYSALLSTPETADSEGEERRRNRWQEVAEGLYGGIHRMKWLLTGQLPESQRNPAFFHLGFFRNFVLIFWSNTKVWLCEIGIWQTFQLSCVLPRMTNRLPFARVHLCVEAPGLFLLGVMINVRSAPKLRLVMT